MVWMCLVVCTVINIEQCSEQPFCVFSHSSTWSFVASCCGNVMESELPCKERKIVREPNVAINCNGTGLCIRQ